MESEFYERIKSEMGLGRLGNFCVNFIERYLWIHVHRIIARVVNLKQGWFKYRGNLYCSVMTSAKSFPLMILRIDTRTQSMCCRKPSSEIFIKVQVLNFLITFF